jgi:hypothetical protein
MNKSGKFFAVILILLPAMLSIACTSSGPAGPRDAVIQFFGAMEKDDQAALAHLLDLVELMKNSEFDYSLSTEDKPRVFTSPIEILEDLTGDGLTKKRWFALQRIINEVEIFGETATVEVTFVDKNSSEGYRTKFGVHVVNDKWKIYTFKAN